MNRFAAFSDDELKTLSAAIFRLDGEWRNNRHEPLRDEILNEIERRKAAA